MSPLYVLCCVGLTPGHLGSDTPALDALAGRGFAAPLTSVVPAVTCSAQASMLTGVQPQEHGIVGNGWYFRELNEILLWRQSEALMQRPPIWDALRTQLPGLRVLKHFWWYAMNSSADAAVTPRPVYHHDGRKSPDCYAWPPELKDSLTRGHGRFPLFQFWGPTAGIRSSRWIAESFCTAVDAITPDLALCYLPHLDYDLQRYGPRGPHLAANLRALDDCVGTVLAHAAGCAAQVIVVSEYGLTAVDHGIAINRFLRERDWLAVTRNAAGELLDPGHSTAFAVADHQIAHVYVRDPAQVRAVAGALRGLPGVGAVAHGPDRARFGLDHPRAGTVVALAEAGCWFSHDYWLEQRWAPDFARAVEIHKKPGYDPRELLFDGPAGKRRAAWALLRKKCGLRYIMDPITQDDRRVRGSHGLPASSPDEGPVLIGSDPSWSRRHWHQCDIAGLIKLALAT